LPDLFAGICLCGAPLQQKKEKRVVAAIPLLLLIAILFGVGFAVTKFLIWLAVALLILWIVGWVIGSGASAGGRRWYYW